MAGLLDMIKGGGGDLLKGLAAGAATGFNPLVGLLAVPAIQKSREKRERENEAIRRGDKAREDLLDLFTRPDEMVQGAPSTTLLEGFDGAPGEAVQIPGRRSMVPAYQTPGGQKELMGILSQVDPAAAIQAAMPAAGQGRADPSDIRTMQRLGIPLTEEGFARFKEMDRGPMDPLQALLMQQQFDTRQRTEQRAAEQAAREAEEAEREAASREEQKKMDIGMLESNVDNLIRAYELNSQLGDVKGVAGLLNKPGLPLAEGRRAASALFTPEQGAQFDELSGLIDAIGLERLKVEGFEGNTNARFNAFMQTKPSLNFLGPANAKSIVRNLKGTLLADEAKGFVMDPAERARAERFIDRVENEGLNTLEVGDIDQDSDGVSYEYIGGPRNDPNSWRRLDD